MTGADLKNKRKQLKLTQEQLGSLVGLDRQTIINYEKLDKIPERKSILLDNFFTSKLNNKVSDIYLEKDGVRFYLKEACILVANNPEEAKKITIFKNLIDNEALKLIVKSAKGDKLDLNSFLDTI